MEISFSADEVFFVPRLRFMYLGLTAKIRCNPLTIKIEITSKFIIYSLSSNLLKALIIKLYLSLMKLI